MLHSHLRLRHLSCFLETARLGSLSAAADKLQISQPAASKTIRELEEILGVALFSRAGRSLALTLAGQVFQTHAGSAMADLERAQRAVLAPPKARPRLALGVLPTAATRLVPAAALALRAEDPEAVIEVMTGPNWLLLSLLREGQLDLVIGRMPPQGNGEGLKFTPLYWEKVVPVVRAGHPLLQGAGGAARQSGGAARQGDPAGAEAELGAGRPGPGAAAGAAAAWQPEDLRRYPLMLPPRGAAIAGSVRAWLHSAGLGDPEPAFENVSLAFGREVVLGSDTVWFISEGIVRPEVEAGSLAVLPLRNDLLGGPVGVSQRLDDRETPVMGRMLAALGKAASMRSNSLQ